VKPEDFEDVKDVASDCYCKPQFIEPVVEVKPEDLQYMKQEPADESDCGATHYVKVRFQYANSYNY